MTDSQDIVKCNCRQLSVISLFQCNSFRLEEHILRHLLASWYSYTVKELLFPFISSLHSLLYVVVGRLYIQLCTHIPGSTRQAPEDTKSCWKLKRSLDILPIGKKEGGEKSYDVCGQSYKYVFLQTSRRNRGRGTGNQMSWFQQWKKEEVWNGDWWETVKNTYCIYTLKIYK